MAFSTQRVTSDGTLVLLDIAIEYFDRSEIAVLFNGVVDAYPWAWVGTTEAKISFTPAVPNTVEVMLVRTTDLASVRHIFTLGAKFTTQSLDEDLTQILHIAQEARENATIEEVFHNLNMHGYRIINIGDGINPQDAPSMAQMVVHDAQIVVYKDAAAASAAAALASAAAAAASAASAASDVATAITAHKAAADEHAISGVTGLATALAAKQVTLVSGTNIKTVNGSSLLGSGDLVVTVPDGDKGDITVSGSGTVFTIDQKITLGTSQATTSGTSKDFTGVPSWAKKITFSWVNGSTNGSSLPILQLGDSGGFETTGYLGACNTVMSAGASAGANATTGLLLSGTMAASVVFHVTAVLTLVDAATNTWNFAVSGARSDAANSIIGGGSKSLSDALTQIRFTTVGGTDAFDLGTANIVYEG